MLFHLYCLQNVNYLLLVWQFGDWFWFMWNDSFRSLENDESGFGCFIINLSLYFWRSSWFSVSFLRSQQTNTCFFIGYLSCDLCFTQNLSNTFHRGVFLYLVMLLAGKKHWKQQPLFFRSWNLSLEAFLQISDKQNIPKFLFLLVHLLQYAPQLLHKNNNLVSYLSYQWNGCYIFQHAIFLHILACLLFSDLF